jgi:hypothetical protein
MPFSPSRAPHLLTQREGALRSDVGLRFVEAESRKPARPTISQRFPRRSVD